MSHDAFVEGSSQLRLGDFPDMTSTPIQPLPYANLVADVEAARDALAGLDEELHPPSRPSSPSSDARTDSLKAKIAEAMKYAGYNPRSAKWKRVSDLMKTAATSRRYVGAAPGVRVGENEQVDLGNYKFVLPETEEEWEQCEERWAKRFEKPAPQGKTSKFFPAGTEEQRSPSRVEFVRDKVKAWQATVVPAPPSSSQDGSEVGSVRSSKGKGKETEKIRQSPLQFPVVKRHTAAIPGGKDSLATGKKDVTPAEPPPPAEKDAPGRSPTPLKGIADLSEMEFIPPSFPQQLDTSTPPPNATKRSKPSPIPYHFPSSPSSSPQLPNLLDHIVFPLASSSDLPQPSSDVEKRSRPITPPSGASQRSAFVKRAKNTPPADPAPLAPPPPSTPPQPASPPHTPPRLLSSGRGLGNAKGPPVPYTPERGSLPTLTELLASSRRSRPRPRPPSRKLQSLTTTPAPERPPTDDLALLPALAEEAVHACSRSREPSPAPSRARTLLSSPASGSSGSPHSSGAVPSRPRTPESPLFAPAQQQQQQQQQHQHQQQQQQLPAASFAPLYASTQAGALALAPLGHASQSQAGGMVGYSSQFDVEGQVGLVSDLLERDVDFDGWLRDVPELDAET
ncbi:uncharacterized protein PHACADRAFT_209631 [Phanerochaete carnosa HHB-10118-sp]|uniref:Uncharacterized protein n=1 Tax=Phanerochaete carnosa (strain HHB-10118-sp) TaxID=650164 RepID=K5WA85_PHACS|nr:uncharacterized protein PHACADRAFT_209631 [Phanerochaete carnosa HHB-10118-sp]EKM56135.1 hypothetical protein PHACADRAFT_209631 [Phanerochaete carnosa HHB-10118-sp]